MFNKITLFLQGINMYKKYLKKIRTFLTMPTPHQLLFFVNWILLGIARAAIHLIPLKHLSRYFGTLHKNYIFSTILSKNELAHAVRLRRSIKLAASYTPWHSNCLTQAIVAKFWCHRLKVPYILYIGFAKDSNEPHGYASHAWLTAGPIAITGQHSFANFCVISSYTTPAIHQHAQGIFKIDRT